MLAASWRARVLLALPGLVAGDRVECLGHSGFDLFGPPRDVRRLSQPPRRKSRIVCGRAKIRLHFAEPLPDGGGDDVAIGQQIGFLLLGGLAPAPMPSSARVRWSKVHDQASP